MDHLTKIEDMIEQGVIRAVHFGKSAMPRKVRFCTLDRVGDGPNWTGEGATAQEALDAALDSIEGAQEEDFDGLL